MKILIIGSFREIALEKTYAHNLKLLGHEIIPVETFVGFHDMTESLFGKVWHKLQITRIRQKVNKVIIQRYREVKPDVVLIFKGEDITPDTLQELRSEEGILVNYNPDHPFYFEKETVSSKNITECISMYDLYLTYSQEIKEQLSREGVPAGCIPFGYDARMIKKAQNLNKEVPSFLFVGAWDQDREEWLSQMTDKVNLEIYGNQDWSLMSRGKEVATSFQNRYLIGEEYANVVSRSAGVINLLRPQNMREQSHNMRTFEVPGYGGVLISQRTDEQMSYFEEDKEAIFFSDIEELIDKLDFLVRNPNHARQIKEQALNRSETSGYSYFDRAKALSNMIGEMKDQIT